MDNFSKTTLYTVNADDGVSHIKGRGRMERGNDYEWFNEDEERTYYDPYTGQEITEREYWDNGCSDEMMDNLF